MTTRHLALFFVSACISCWVWAGGTLTPKQDAKEFGVRDLRNAVEAHRATQREEYQREEAWAGRRLTAPELAQLREQVRQQWPSRVVVVAPAESRTSERVVTAPVATAIPPERVWPARSQRP